jgi:hypothetical protein
MYLDGWWQLKIKQGHNIQESSMLVVIFGTIIMCAEMGPLHMLQNN